MRLSFADEKKMKRVLVHACCLAHGASSALRAMLIGARAHLRRGARMCERTRVDRPRGLEFGVSGSERASAECDPSRVGSARASPVAVAAAAFAAIWKESWWSRKNREIWARKDAGE